MRRSVVEICGIAFGMLLTCGAVEAASFDCGAAKGADEKAVCYSMELSDLDVRMATLYEVTGHLVAMGQRGMLQDDQRDFLKTRAACGANQQCLKNAYQQRIRAIQEVLQRVYSQGPF